MIFDRLSTFMSQLGDTLKSLIKVAVESRRCTISTLARRRPLVILGNGPSLNITLAEQRDKLDESDLMAVNFAANTPVVTNLKPRYYIVSDPHFFTRGVDSNGDRLMENISKVDWPMTLLLPARSVVDPRVQANGKITVERFNPVGAQGFKAIIYPLYTSGRAMPRPRNVLIPAIMTGIKAGYTEIYLTGADHSWSRTLSVDDRNTVVSVQPHFYEDKKEERERVTSVYRNVKLHEIMYSFHVAFKAYHTIAAYARRRSIEIINATPGSFIDAFDRRPL